MFRKQFRQPCKKCKGTGTSTTVLTDKDDNVILAPVYRKGEEPRPQYEPCKECKGSGLTMQDSPTEILVEGQKIKLEENERRARFNDAPLASAS